LGWPAKKISTLPINPALRLTHNTFAIDEQRRAR
jgi:hypothetical protein